MSRCPNQDVWADVHSLWVSVENLSGCWAGRFLSFSKDSAPESLLIYSLPWWVLWIRLHDLPPSAVTEHAHVSALPVILVTICQTVHTSPRLENDHRHCTQT